MKGFKFKRGFNIPKRILITGVLILCQIALIIFLASYTIRSVYGAYTLFELLSIICVIVIVNERGNPSYKISWIVFILLIPFAGWIFFLIFGGNRVFPYLKRRYLKINDESADHKRQNPEIMASLEQNELLGARQAKYLLKESGYPVYGNTETVFYPSGEEAFAAVLRDLATAEKYIFLEFFIVADGYMWDEIHKILLERLANGVEIRLMFDDFGSASRQNKDFVKQLRREGIKLSVFNPIKPSSNIFLNNRNHRKMIVIDGRVAFTGGFNIADEYINKINRFGHWLDCGIRIEGDAVKSFTVMFCDMWRFTSFKTKLDTEAYLLPPKAECGIQCANFVQPYCDGPFDDKYAAEGIYLQLINTARRYVYIATPYLIIDNTMCDALERAAKSGVDVRIICPSHPDKWYVHPVTQYHYSQLMDAGIKIYEYTDGFIHSKLFAVDDRFATVGTVNMDYRSFFFHFECGVWLCDNSTVTDIKRNLTDTMQKSTLIDKEKWAKRPFKMRFKQFFLHLFAPFM